MRIGTPSSSRRTGTSSSRRTGTSSSRRKGTSSSKRHSEEDDFDLEDPDRLQTPVSSKRKGTSSSKRHSEDDDDYFSDDDFDQDDHDRPQTPLSSKRKGSSSSKRHSEDEDDDSVTDSPRHVSSKKDDSDIEQLKHYGFSDYKILTSLQQHNNNHLETSLDLLNIKKEDQLIKKMVKADYQLEPRSFAGGTFGKVYNAKVIGDDEKDWAVKISKDPEHDIEVIINEMGYYYLFSKHGIGPKLPYTNAFYISDRDHLFAIVTEKYTSDLDILLGKIHRSYHQKTLDSIEITNRLRDIETRIPPLINKMLDLGVICIDLKPKNMLVNYDDNLEIKDLVLTDFGIDWCCNTKVKPVCDYIDKPNYLEQSNYRYYISLMLYLCICVESLYRNIKLFPDKIKELEKVIDTPDFINFIDDICKKETGCGTINPPFHYLFHHYKTELTWPSYVPNNNRRLNTSQDATREKKGINIYLIKLFLKRYNNKKLPSSL